MLLNYGTNLCSIGSLSLGSAVVDEDDHKWRKMRVELDKDDQAMTLMQLLMDGANQEDLHKLHKMSRGRLTKGIIGLFTRLCAHGELIVELKRKPRSLSHGELIVKHERRVRAMAFRKPRSLSHGMCAPSVSTKLNVDASSSMSQGTSHMLENGDLSSQTMPSNRPLYHYSFCGKDGHQQSFCYGIPNTCGELVLLGP